MSNQLTAPPNPEFLLWYYADAKNEPVGPLPFSELQRLASAGVIQPETHVIEKGGTEWKKFASIVPPPVHPENNPAPADTGIPSAPFARTENAADKLQSPAKKAEECFQTREQTFEDFSDFSPDVRPSSRAESNPAPAAESSHVPAKENPPLEAPEESRLREIFDAAKDSSAQGVPKAEKSGQAQKTKGNDVASKKEKAFAIGCAVLFWLAVIFFIGKCFGGKESSGEAGGSSEHTSQPAKTFDFTPDSFREAFNQQARAMDLGGELEIQQWKFGRGEIQDTVETKFNSGVLIAAIDKKTGKLKDISALAAHGSAKQVSELLFLTMVVVATADPSIPADKRAETVLRVLAERTKKESLGHLEIGAFDIDAALMFYAYPKP